MAPLSPFRLSASGRANLNKIMMKKLIGLSVAIMLCMTGMAKPVSEIVARRVACNFLQKMTGVTERELLQVYSFKLPSSMHAAFYTFAIPRGGFVVVAGDDVAFPILAYSFENPFPADVPDHVESFLADLAMEIDAALQQGVKSSTFISEQWQALLDTPAPLTTGEGTVGPLLSTKWMQHAPYNALCPSSSGVNAKVGCGAIALGQVLRYWQYPANPRGVHSYSENNFGTHTVHFDSASYDYSLMPIALTGSSSSDSIIETAKLLYHCGVSINMQYGISASGVFASNIASALINHFGYAKNVGNASKSEYSEAMWVQMLKNNLDLNRPIIYRGVDSENANNAHIWVCDGYDAQNRFHFNFGWNGNHDGFYLLSAISPGTTDYTSQQRAILNIYPDSLSKTVSSSKWGNSRYYVDDTMWVYKQKTLNDLNEYLYTGFSGNGTRHTMTFVPSDSSCNLRIDIIDSMGRNVSVYDGENKDVMLDGPMFLHANNYPMLSSHGAIVIVDSSLMYSHNYAFRIVADNGYNDITGLSIRLADDTIRLMWNPVASAVQYQIEYGTEGFSHGQGVVVNREDTSFVLPTFAANDYYVRAVFADASVGVWKKISSSEVFWTDIVTSPPTGFVRDADGNVHISSSVGLSWLVSEVNGLNGQTVNTYAGKTVSLSADIDLAPFQWTAIDNFAGTFDGNNHSINGLYIKKDANNQGFFGRTSHAPTIANVNLINCSVHGRSYVGALYGDMGGGDVHNCSVSGGAVTGEYRVVGGLIGIIRSGVVRNSFSDASVSVANTDASQPNDGIGGLVGWAANLGQIICIENCYSRGSAVGRTRVGGLVGCAMKPTSSYYQINIANCYSSVNVSASSPINPMCGSLIGNAEGVTIQNCYGRESSVPLIDSVIASTITNVSLFAYNGTLASAIVVNGVSYSMLLGALNAWVSSHPGMAYKSWIPEEYGALPIHGAVIRTYQITVLSNNDSWGLVDGDGEYAEGESVTILAEASQGCRFVGWSDGFLDNPRTVQVNCDSTFVALFIPVYSISVVSGDDLMGVVGGGGEFDMGTETTIWALAYDGYRFVRWDDGSNDNPRTVLAEFNAIYTALFEVVPMETFVITVSSADTTMGAVGGGGEFMAGTEITIYANAFAGYRFVSWTDGNTENPRVVRVMQDAEYMAQFATNQASEYTIVVLSDNETMGTVWGGGTYSTGAEILIAAIPAEGYVFERWQDGETQNPRSIVVDSDATYVAYFGQLEGVESPHNNSPAIYTQANKTIVCGAEGLPVDIYDVFGKMIVSKIATSEHFEVTLPSSGVYMVSVGGYPIRKIVILY